MKREQWDAALQFVDDDLLMEALGSPKRKKQNRWVRLAPTISGVLAATLLLTIGLSVWLKQPESTTMDTSQNVESSHAVESTVVDGMYGHNGGMMTNEGVAGENLQHKEHVSAGALVTPGVDIGAPMAPGSKEPLQAPWIVRVLQSILQWLQSWMIVK